MNLFDDDEPDGMDIADEVAYADTGRPLAARAIKHPSHAKVLLVVASHSQDAADLRQMLDMLGLAPSRPKRRRGRPPIDHGHGDYRTYAKGCRCEGCREAHRVKCAEAREARAKNPDAADRAGHGKGSTYKNYGCRCRACSKANTEDVSAYRTRRRQRKAMAETGGAR